MRIIAEVFLPLAGCAVAKPLMGESFMSKFVIPSIIILALLIYGNTFHVPFVFDDIHAIVERGEIRGLSHFSSIRHLLKPRAVVDLTFALNLGCPYSDIENEADVSHGIIVNIGKNWNAVN